MASALKLGQARGVILLACEHQAPGCIFEFAPRAVKKAITGYGAATKNQIQYMVKKMLRIQSDLSEDAADALAIAILCASHVPVEEKMIGYIEGKVSYCEPERCMVLVQGIGYEVLIHTRTFAQLQSTPTVCLYLHQQIREDAHTLFGFLSIRERDLFRLLIQLQGVGPKLGLVICDSLSESMILQAVRDKDVGRFQAVKGVGARMAERLVVELKPKLAKWQPVMAVASVGGDASAEVIQEAVAALAQLGYAPAMLMDKVRDLFMPEMTTEELVKRTLQHLSRL